MDINEIKRIQSELPAVTVDENEAAFNEAIEEYEYDYYSDYIMVKEDNVKFCVDKNELGLENCLEADADTIAAALLHGVLNHEKCDIDKLSENFSESVVDLVKGITKIKQLKFNQNYPLYNVKGEFSNPFGIVNSKSNILHLTHNCMPVPEKQKAKQ